MLYWFRTPPGVKVGRAALDDDAMRRIEEQNPELEFDWPRIMKGQGSPPTEPRAPATNGDVRRPRPHESPRPSQAAPEEPRVESSPRVESTRPEEEPAPPEEQVVARERREEPLQVVPADVVIPAHDKLGVEGVQRLRHRYAEIVMRIGERVSDPVRRDELKAHAERLNPDTWTTPEDVSSALEQYESVLASVREVVGRRRRRRRRGRGGEARTAELNGQPAGDSGEAEKAAEPDDLGPDDTDPDEV